MAPNNSFVPTPLRETQAPAQEQHMHYLAYGSNLHPLRLVLRVPNARLVGTIRLEGCRLTFHKRSADGSSKCNLEFSDNANQIAHAAIYNIPENEVHLLDAAEGLEFGYFKQQMTVKVEGCAYLAFLYLADKSHLASDLEPYHWYKGFVLAGAGKHQFPAEYLEQISKVSSKHDPVDSRRIEMENLLVQLQG